MPDNILEGVHLQCKSRQGLGFRVLSWPRQTPLLLYPINRNRLITGSRGVEVTLPISHQGGGDGRRSRAIRAI